MKIYLAGPMRGHPEGNKPAFDAAADKLRAEGHEVFSPADDGAETPQTTQKQRRKLLLDDLTYILQEANAIAFLPGWEESKGARAEWATAVFAELKFIYL